MLIPLVVFLVCIAVYLPIRAMREKQRAKLWKEQEEYEWRNTSLRENDRDNQ